MHRRILLVLLLMFIAVHSSRASDFWLNIDCGVDAAYEDPVNSIEWNTDSEYLKKLGETKVVVANENLSMRAMYTLRSFPDGTTNCYALPLEETGKFLVRAGFYYGNYDKLSRPPTFDLVINGNITVRVVNTSLSNEPVFHEVMFVTDRTETSVCLVKTQEEDIPFISSIEVSWINPEDYNFMTKTMVLYLQTRINYGANSSIPDRFSPFHDEYNRIWKQKQLADYQNVTMHMIDSIAENRIPFEVRDYAIEAHKVNESLFLPIPLLQPWNQLPVYFVLYIGGTYIYPPGNETRKFTIYIDGESKNTTQLTPGNLFDSIVIVSPVKSSVNVTISPVHGTTMPPAINAMEIFSVANVSSINISKANYLLPPSSIPLLFYCFLGVACL